MRHIFLKKSYAKRGGETVSRPFSKNQNRAYLWMNSFKFYAVFVIVCQVEVYLKISKLSCRPLAFTSSKAFLKNKKFSGTSLPASFSA